MSIIDNGDGTITRTGLPQAALDALSPRKPGGSIEVRCKGIALAPTVRVDADGYHVFTLDPAKHDPFDVFARLCSKIDETMTPEQRQAQAREQAERDARHAAVQAKIKAGKYRAA